MKDKKSFQPFLPEAVGRSQETILVGKHSGSASVRSLLEKAGFNIDRNTATNLLEHIRSFAVNKGSALTETEVIGLLYSMDSGT